MGKCCILSELINALYSIQIYNRFPSLSVLWLTSEIRVATLNLMFDNSIFFTINTLWISGKRFNKKLTNRKKASICILSPEMVEKPRKIVAVEGDHKLAIVLSANKWVYTVKFYGKTSNAVTTILIMHWSQCF